ncbi:MAG: AGE family epimerase/isomerase [Ferruginibacter sp.]|nr:AGE family epimerase/isomerase [Chitinophagaceae bacterium]
MIATENLHILPHYNKEVVNELSSILDFWMYNTLDEKQGGFLGKVDNNNVADHAAPKSVVLNSRILWTFSAAYLLEKKPEHLDMATRAYKYIVDYFIDRKYGGVYWSVDCNGRMLDGRKQIYGLAFCMYGLTEYYKASGEKIALYLAKDLYDHIEKYSLDKKKGGYIEAFTQGWKLPADLRLSEKDNNEKKTANTHLHIIEAYANLYAVWPDTRVLDSIKHLLDVFDQHIIDSQTFHLRLFMDEDWNVKSSLISYGHDIEAAWLLLQCAEICVNTNYPAQFEDLSSKMAEAAAEGLDADGGLWYEYDPARDELIKEKHSWPQAEAMIGFFNAYQVSGNEKYLHHSLNSWEFIKNHLKDNNNGEWFWGVNKDYSVMGKDKAGFWKCPYHNSRACIELSHRIKNINYG